MQPQTSDQQTTRSNVQDASSSSSIPSLQYQLSGGGNKWNCASEFDTCKPGSMETKFKVAVTAEDAENEFLAIRSEQFAVRDAEVN